MKFFKLWCNFFLSYKKLLHICIRMYLFVLWSYFHLTYPTLYVIFFLLYFACAYIHQSEGRQVEHLWCLACPYRLSINNWDFLYIAYNFFFVLNIWRKNIYILLFSFIWSRKLDTLWNITIKIWIIYCEDSNFNYYYIFQWLICVYLSQWANKFVYDVYILFIMY